MNYAEWDGLPTLALSNIFEYLDFKDRLQASSVCWHWRSVPFQKRFFKNFKFNLHIDNDHQCNFFLQCLLGVTSEVTIIFDFHCAYHIEKVGRLLSIIAKSDHLIGLRFHTTFVGIKPTDEYSEDKLIERVFVEPIKALLARIVPSFKVLDLGAIESLTYYANDFLEVLARPQDLQEITFASVKYNPSHYPILAVEHVLFEKFTSLQVLSLDYDTLNEDILRTLQILPLKTFMICVHGLDRGHPGISEAAWSQFSSKFQNLKLILTLIYAYEAVKVLDHNILRRSMPITHLRVIFCNFMNVVALHAISMYYHNTLMSIQWIDSAFQENQRSSMGPRVRSNQDPFVMMSWRCKCLEEIVLHGYVLDPNNLVGISRLRGQYLKKLEVSMPYNPSPEMSSIYNDEISFQLGYKWKLKDLQDIHPALGCIPVSRNVRDSYILDLIRSDLRN